MRVKKVSFGHLVLLMPEEQKSPQVLEAIRMLSETGKVVTFVSGGESTKAVICRLIKSSMENQ